MLNVRSGLKTWGSSWLVGWSVVGWFVSTPYRQLLRLALKIVLKESSSSSKQQLCSAQRAVSAFMLLWQTDWLTACPSISSLPVKHPPCMHQLLQMGLCVSEWAPFLSFSLFERPCLSACLSVFSSSFLNRISLAACSSLSLFHPLELIISYFLSSLYLELISSSLFLVGFLWLTG